MKTIYDSMVIKLFLPSLFFLFIGIAMYLLFGVFIPSQFENTIYLKSIASSARIFAPNLFDFFLILSFIFFCIGSLKIFLWTRGKLDTCNNCYGILTLKNGRYGYYKKCLACGKGKKL